MEWQPGDAGDIVPSVAHRGGRRDNWTLSPVVMCLICMVMSAVIYLPFLRAYERSLMKTEVEKAKNSVPVAETVS